MTRRDAEIDRLFQLPPDEFTAARNALANQAGADGAAIRKLQKPPVAAWAINQLFWKKRDVYDALTDAAGALRRTHKDILTGRRGDLRAASRAHDDALDAALKETLSVMSESGQKASDPTRQAIINTLRALPADETPGRLTRTLQPGGFEMLSGITPRPRAVSAGPARHTPAAPEPAKSRPGSGTEKPAVDAREVARARTELATALRELREAEQRARREEFEAARATREATKAADRLKAAREALAAAQQEAEQAGTDHEAARSRLAAAERRAADGATVLSAARERATAAQAALDAMRRQ